GRVRGHDHLRSLLIREGLPPLAARKRATVSPKRPCSRCALRAAAGETDSSHRGVPPEELRCISAVHRKVRPRIGTTKSRAWPVIRRPPARSTETPWT